MPLPTPDHLIQQIYDAADDPQGLSRLSQTLIGHFEGDRCHLLLLDDKQQPLLETWHGGTREDIDAYNLNWRKKDPRFATALSNLGKVLSDAEVSDPNAFEGSDFHNDFMRPIGQRYSLFTIAPIHGGQIFATAFMRERRRGGFNEESKNSLATLLPHLARATRLRWLLDEAQTKCASLDAAFDQLPVMVALLDAQGNVLFANSGAKRMLDEGDGLRWNGARLSATSRSDSHALYQAIAEAARFADEATRASNDAHVPRSVHVHRREDAPGVVTLFPLRPNNMLREKSGGARVLCVLYDPARRPRLDPYQLRDLFGLTPTESALACALVEGTSLAEFASTRGNSIETVRTHMKRLLSKTGTRTQSDFVRDMLGRLAFHKLR